MADETPKQWGTPDAVFQTSEILQRVEAARALDRAKVDVLANGGRPYSEAEVQQFQHQINVNWLELTQRLQEAIGQINNAFIPNGNFFTAVSKKGKPHKKAEYGQKFTKAINRILKDGVSGHEHFFVMRSRNASVAVHGIGPLMWFNDWKLIPRFIPLEDLLIPTDTSLDLSSNMTYFAVNLYLTPGELQTMALDGPKDSGWNQEMVKKILKDLRMQDGTPVYKISDVDWYQRPEALQEFYKQNAGYLESDAVPKCKLRAFYYKEPEKGKWHRKVILRENMPNVPANGKDAAFVFESKKPVADRIGDFMQCQFGDNSIVPPLKYHSVRGMGTMLYAPCFTLNRLRSQAMQHVFQNLQTWWNIDDPNDQARAKQILLMNHGVVPPGARIVPNTERHQVDPSLLDFGVSQMKQNIGENSTSFSPEADTGTKKERTKFEVQAQLQASSANVNNVLSMMYQQEKFYYAQLVKRACNETSDDPAVKEFQEECQREGIPKELMKADNWEVLPERVLGAGDGALGQAQADALMAQRPLFDPDSQRFILRRWVSQTTNDPQLATALVPDVDDGTTSGTRVAEEVYASMMRGIRIPMRRGVDQETYAGALLAMAQSELQRMQQAGSIGTPEDLTGFQTVLTCAGEVIQWLSMDDRNKEVARQLADQAGQIANILKKMDQQQREAAEAAQSQIDPEAQAKAAATQLLAQTKAENDRMLAETKMQINQALAEQKLMLKEMQTGQKMSQSDMSHQEKLRMQSEKTNANLEALGMQTAASLEQKGIEVGADVAALKAKTEADVQATRKKAAAQPKVEKSVDKKP